MDNIPGGMISGLDEELLTFVTEESSERFVHEISSAFYNELAAIEKMDKVLSDEEEQKLVELEASSNSVATDKQTKMWVTKFKEFLESRGLSTSFEAVPKRVLNDYLRAFYAQLRTKEGCFYAPASLICIRAALHRHLTSPLLNRDTNILTGEEFRRANGVLKAMVKAYLSSDQVKPQSFERISNEDLIKVRKYFVENESSVTTLQEECLFNIIYYFQLRGRENLRALKKNTIGFKISENGREVAYIQVPLLQKNVKPSLNAKEYEDVKSARMVEQPSDLGHCPVKRLHEYMNSLPVTTKDDTLFPCYNPKKKTFSSKMVLGKDKLGSLMQTLSEKAKLSTRYTNHCLRVTGVNVLHENGLSNEEITNITGHKNPKSVQRYLRRNERKMVKACDLLANPTSEKQNFVSMQSVLKSSEPEEEGSSCTPCKVIKLEGVYNNCTFNF